MKTADFELFVQTNWGMPGKASEIETMSHAELLAEYADLRDRFIMTTGMAGETGEVMEHLKKHVRNGTLDIAALELELGDTLHYLTRVATRYGLSLEGIMIANKAKLEARAIERGWAKAHPNGSEEVAA